MSTKTGYVTDIEMGVEDRGNYTLNAIHFKDGIVAMERTGEGKTQFIKGPVQYEITHPGKVGKPDWIKCVAHGMTGRIEVQNDDTYKIVVEAISFRDCQIIMQNAWGHAMNLAVPADVDEFIFRQTSAQKIGDAIIESAKDLKQKHSAI